MKKKATVIIGLTVVLAAMTALVTPALAGSGQGRAGKTGIWCYRPDFTRVEEVVIDGYEGEKAFLETVENAEWTGPLTGESIDYGLAVSRPDGPTLFAATVVFDSVTVRGRTGGLELDVHGGRRDGTANWWGALRITSATGDLEGLEGRGSWWGPGYSLETPEECGVIHYSFRNLRFTR